MSTIIIQRLPKSLLGHGYAADSTIKVPERFLASQPSKHRKVPRYGLAISMGPQTLCHRHFTAAPVIFRERRFNFSYCLSLSLAYLIS